MTLRDALQSLPLDPAGDTAVALSPTLPPRRAALLSRRIARALDDAGVPHSQRVWIIAAGADDAAAARLSAAVADAVGGAALILHDPRDPDALIFQRRIPGQPRGGVYLNERWQQAACRIVVGDPAAAARGLSAWFNSAAQVSPADLNADLCAD